MPTTTPPKKVEGTARAASRPMVALLLVTGLAACSVCEVASMAYRTGATCCRDNPTVCDAAADRDSVGRPAGAPRSRACQR